MPRNLLAPDQTTLAIEKELSATEAEAKAAKTMKHDMQNMPGMQHGEMQGMRHEGMKVEQHGEMQHGQTQHGVAEPEKKAVADEMKKTADEMKATSDEMKKKSDETKTGAQIYTCPMHPQVQSDKPGKCPICGMTLVKKKVGQ